MTTNQENVNPLMQRSVLILILALTVILLLTAVIFENPPVTDNMASADKEQAPPVSAEKAERARERHLMLGRAYLDRGSYQKALEQLQVAQMYGKDDPLVLQALGMVHVAMNDFVEAEQTFNRLVESDPANVSGYTNLAITQMLQGRHKAAAATAQLGIDRTGVEMPGPLYLVMAAAYANNGDLAHSRVALYKAHDIMGDSLTRFTNSSWAARLRNLPEYGKIANEAGHPPSEPAESSELLPSSPP